jgi:hypothetical protein
MRVRWVSTVFSEMKSALAISSFERPQMSSSKTSRSRDDSCDTAVGVEWRHELFPAQHRRDRVLELGRGGLLRQVSAGARAQRFGDELGAIEHRQHQDRLCHFAAAHVAHERDAAGVAQSHVDERDVEARRVGELERAVRVRSLGNDAHAAARL